MSKTGFQTQRSVGWEAEYVARSGCAFWMGIDNYPQLACRVIGRVYYDQGDTDRVVSMGASGADIVFARAEPTIRNNPGVHAWVLLNEASIWNSSVRAGFPAFNQRLTSRLAAIGTRHVACNVNVGHPDATYWDAGIVAIGQACQGASYLGLHGYSWPGVMDGWSDYVGRFERIYASLRSRGFSPPPCLMTELGLDRAITGQGHAGWRQVPLSPQQLAEQIAGFEARIAGNGDVVGALWFLAGAGSPWDAYGFDVDQGTAMVIADRISSPAPPEPPSPPEPPQPPDPGEYALGIDVSQYQTDIDPAVAWSAGARFVIMRLGDGLNKDPYFEQYWQAFGERGFLRGCYHVLRPNVDGQAAFIRDTLAGRVPEMGLWGDYEVDGLDAARIERYVTYVEMRAGMRPNTYSRASLLNAWSPLPAIVTGTDLWIASPGQPTPVLPTAWNTWKLWQFGQRTIDGRTVDVNYYNGTVAQLFAEYGAEPEPITVSYLWYDGLTPVTEAQFKQEFGDFPVTPGGEYHAAEFQAVTGPSTFRFGVFDTNGNPIPGVKVVFYWPDAPACPGAGYDEKGVIGETKDSGWAEFGMGTGAYYQPSLGQIGPHAAWIYGAASDRIGGIGMLWATEHDHFDVVVMPGTVVPPTPSPSPSKSPSRSPSPSPSEAPDDDVAALIAEARALLAQADAKLAQAEALL